VISLSRVGINICFRLTGFVLKDVVLSRAVCTLTSSRADQAGVIVLAMRLICIFQHIAFLVGRLFCQGHVQ